jgi:DNA-binding NarL/FixJ family response regulator
VVIVSAHVDEELEKQLLETGVSGILAKPFEVADVIDQMDQALARKRAWGEGTKEREAADTGSAASRSFFCLRVNYSHWTKRFFL